MKTSTKQTELKSLDQPKAVYAASERQHTAAGGEVQVPKGGTVFTSDVRRSKEIVTRVGEANAVLCELLSLCDDKTGAFKHRKVGSF